METMLEIMYVIKVLSSMKINNTNIETFYTHSFHYLDTSTLHTYKKQKMFALSLKNSSIRDTRPATWRKILDQSKHSICKILNGKGPNRVRNFVCNWSNNINENK